MSLFPAYSGSGAEGAGGASPAPGPASAGSELSAGELESALLASDEEAAAAPARRPAARAPADYYEDARRDVANLRVSTLYYPGRPEYRAGGGPLGARRRQRAGPRGRARRYWHAAAEPGAEQPPRAPPPGAGEQAWLRYVALAGGALAAAQAAAAACDSERARAALHRARRQHLPPGEALAALRADLAAERRPRVRLELWTRLLDALGPAHADAAAAAALADLAALPAAYPRLVYAHGCVLRAAGLWERLVLAAELTAAMSFPPGAAFPPPPEPGADARREEALEAREAVAGASGLPPSAVWARVERLRAAAHWRPARAAADDPQRAPAACDAAELLRPVRDASVAADLSVALLRLAKVPLPGSERAARAAGPEPPAGEHAIAESLAMLMRAARRLPAGHPARPADAGAARAALAPLLDPPHYFSDTDGYLSWTNALWEACCGWAEGWRRAALTCWRLRWLHALALLAEPAEARRLRREARAVVKRHAPDSPEAFAHLARLEPEPAAGRRAALQALRAALRDPAAPAEAALFAARVLAELSAGAEAGDARHALCCAVLRRAPPAGDELGAPPAELEAAARARCDQRCAELERGWAAAAGAEEAGEEVCCALVAGAGEWGAARAVLTPPGERARLLARLLAAPGLHGGGAGGAALQYGEQTACALTLCGAGGARAAAARAAATLYPRNALLQLVCAGAPLWAGGAGGAPAEGSVAGALPALLAAEGAAGGAERLARVCARAARGPAPSALLAAARLEADPSPQRALYAALADHPDHKWLYVRGAAWCGGEAAALADALLERGLRAHTLLDELPHLQRLHPATQPPAHDS